jgi:hypothetical protein
VSEHYPRHLEGETIWKWCPACEAVREFTIVPKTEHACVLGPCISCEMRRAANLREKDAIRAREVDLKAQQGALFK